MSTTIAVSIFAITILAAIIEGIPLSDFLQPQSFQQNYYGENLNENGDLNERSFDGIGGGNLNGRSLDYDDLSYWYRRGLDGIGGGNLNGRGLDGIGGGNLNGRGLDGIGGGNLNGRGLDGIGGGNLNGRGLDGIGGGNLNGRGLDGIGGGNLNGRSLGRNSYSRSFDGIGGGNLNGRGLDGIGGGNLNGRGLDGIGGGNLNGRGLDGIGGGNLNGRSLVRNSYSRRSFDGIGGGNLNGRGLDGIGGGNLNGRGLDGIGGGNLNGRGLDGIGGGNLNEEMDSKQYPALTNAVEFQKREISSRHDDGILKKKPQNRRGYLNSLVAGGAFGRAARSEGSKEIFLPYGATARNMRSLNSLTAGGAFGKRTDYELTQKYENDLLLENMLRKYWTFWQIENLFDMANRRLANEISRAAQDYLPHDKQQKNDTLWAMMKLTGIPAKDIEPETWVKQMEVTRTDQHQKAFNNKNEPLTSTVFQDVDAYRNSEYLQHTSSTP